MENMSHNVANIRKNYTHAELHEKDVLATPVNQFKHWFAQALNAGIEEVNAMTLSTTGADGKPSARIVLLKAFDEDGFSFFTNYGSRKAGQLNENPYAALTFLWKEIERQVRIEGSVEKLDAKKSEEYFHSRPRLSQIGALASQQSKRVSSKEEMLETFANIQLEFEGREIPMPMNWGGFLLLPSYFEFWQGRPSRMHDRIVYERLPDKSWEIYRLYP